MTNMNDALGISPTPQPAFLTIGNFDGVHRGHQALIAEMVRAAHAAEALAGLLTFDPHPLTVLQPEVPILYLTSPEERAELLTALGLDFVLILPFTAQTARLSATEFMQELLSHLLKQTPPLTLRELWIGPDFALGHHREGNARRLSEIGAGLGYEVRVIPPFDWHGEPVRSSRIRALLARDGAVDGAADLLGRPYQLWGQVVEGAQRGRRLGFPTANLHLLPHRLIPKFGVYACWAWREDRGYPAVVNVGVRPSFDNGAPSVEAYLMDVEENLYGERLGLSFIRRLRDEMKFADVSALIAQIRRDADSARRILTDPPDHAGPDAGWDEVRHTADWAIRVVADSQRQLFARAGRAMFQLQDADPRQPITLARTVAVTADDPANLLVAWLNRLLWGQEVGQEMYTRFEIHEISDRGLRGVAYGYRGTPGHTAVKAATYYDLDVRESPEGWTATVTFDV